MSVKHDAPLSTLLTCLRTGAEQRMRAARAGPDPRYGTCPGPPLPSFLTWQAFLERRSTEPVIGFGRSAKLYNRLPTSLYC